MNDRELGVRCRIWCEAAAFVRTPCRHFMFTLHSPDGSTCLREMDAILKVWRQSTLGWYCPLSVCLSVCNEVYCGALGRCEGNWKLYRTSCS